MYTYTRSIKNDMGGIMPDLKYLKHQIKAYPDIRAILMDYGNNGDVIWIHFSQDLTPEQITVLDGIFVPGPMTIEPYVLYQSDIAMIDLPSGDTVSLVGTDAVQSLRNKTLCDPSNAIISNGLFVSSGGVVRSDSSAPPVSGQVLVASDANSMAFQSVPILTRTGAFATYGGGSQTIPAKTPTAVLLNSDSYNSGMYKTDTCKSIIPSSGLYNVKVSLYQSNNTLPADSTVYIMVYVNDGMVNAQACGSNGSSSSVSYRYDATLPFRTDDVVQLFVYSGNGDLNLVDVDVIDGITFIGLSSMSITLASND